MELLKAIMDLGLAVALVWFFVRWIKARDDRQEKQQSETLVRLGQRLDQREQEIGAAKDAHIQDLRTVVSNNTTFVANNTTVVQQLAQELRDRPCLQKRKECENAK